MRAGVVLWGLLALGCLAAVAQEVETVSSDGCVDCHPASLHGTVFAVDLEHSVHDGLECLDCHQDREVVPHDEASSFLVGCEGCRNCHTDAGEEYKAHGRMAVGDCEEMPQCKDCHGDHEILPSSAKHAKTHPTNLPQTCGRCHENLDLSLKYELLLEKPVEIYESSIHGQATRGGIYVAATCNDCHSTGGTAHRILASGNPESSINHFNIPRTCGVCHRGVESDYWDGIHGKLVARGKTDAPVCTDCHGEHGILSPRDSRSPVSRSHVAEDTCSPCHESTTLNEKYGLSSGHLATFIDSYHGLKSKAGDIHVANCASCHGVHRILPSSDATSTIHPDNLQTTCGECHPKISVKMAATPIHSVNGEGLRTGVADVVEEIYIVAIFVIIGSMLLLCGLDFLRHLLKVLAVKPQVQRMRMDEVWQHVFLAITFVVLVLSGFALRYSESWLSHFFFGWERGFELRGIVHRSAAVLFCITIVWHVLFLILSRRGRAFIYDMLPLRRDFVEVWHQLLYNLGRRPQPPRSPRFGYVEKAEYWALLWGTTVMILTGWMLWFDNWFIQFLPKGVLDVALVVHFWEAWLATLAIGVWHLYFTVYRPGIYPMNPAWLTGKMPEAMYRHEHPEHLAQAKAETEEWLRRKIEEVSFLAGSETPVEEADEPPAEGDDESV